MSRLHHRVKKPIIRDLLAINITRKTELMATVLQCQLLLGPWSRFLQGNSCWNNMLSPENSCSSENVYSQNCSNK